MPRNTSLNWFMPALVNSSVGSSPGITGLEATTWWPLLSKKLRKVARIWLAFIVSLGSGVQLKVVMPMRAAAAARARSRVASAAENCTAIVMYVAS